MEKSLSERAEELFLEIVELAPAEQLQFLDLTCAGNPGLRAEVEALVRASEKSAAYFDQLNNRIGIASMVNDVGEKQTQKHVGESGKKVGQYTLTDPVGTGGMGTVWKARRNDGRFEGEVAIKLLNHSTNPSALQRFELEGQYLAKLTHSNIARLMDAGIEAGNQPYLVLEYVHGLSIDKYCDSHQLNITDRIDIFIHVLEAVAHAHANLIVHRDIKPSNILVTEEGKVKLLDFGVAKLLQEDGSLINSALTIELGAALTPEYASPEQLEGNIITTAADIYSLGLVLWLLLTGKTARDTSRINSLSELRNLAIKSPTTMLDAVSHGYSAKELHDLARQRKLSPTELTKLLSGDLNSIVLKSLAIDPLERYSSATDFAEDLRRYLRHEPVTAHIHTFGYRTGKFVRRYRGTVVSTLLIGIALTTAAAIAAYQSIEAKKQRDAALYMQQRVQASNEFLELLLGELGPSGKPLTLVELLDHGVKLLDQQFGAEELFIARTLYDVSIFYATLGQVDKQLQLLSQAENLAVKLGDERLLGTALCAQARARIMEYPAQARQQIAEGKHSLARAPEPYPDGLKECYRAEALLLEADSNRDGAIESLLAALQVVDSSPVPSDASRAVILNDLSEQYLKAGRTSESLAVNAELLELLDRSGRGATLAKIIYLLNRAAILGRMGEVVDATSLQKEAIKRMEYLESSGPILIGGSLHYGASLHRLAEYNEALAQFQSGLKAAEAVNNVRFISQFNLLIGRTLIKLLRGEEAELYLAKAEKVYNETPGANVRLLNVIDAARAEAFLISQDIAGARQSIESALARADYPQQKNPMNLMEVLPIAVEIALAAQDMDSAEQYAEDALDMAVSSARAPEQSAYVGQALLLRARTHIVNSKLDAALEDIQSAIVSLGNGLGDNHPDTIEALKLQAELNQTSI